MMHGREKSDPAVVAMKPAKSAAQAVGELVERRAGAKGKAEQVARTGHRAGHACISNLLRLRHAYTLPSSPEAGARCLNWARRVLCGGRRVISVPTATSGLLLANGAMFARPGVAADTFASSDSDIERPYRL